MSWQVPLLKIALNYGATMQLCNAISSQWTGEMKSLLGYETWFGR